MDKQGKRRQREALEPVACPNPCADGHANNKKRWNNESIESVNLPYRAVRQKQRDASRVQGRPGKCPLATSDGRSAPHYRTREEAAEHAATGFPAFTKEQPQWALEENALKHPILDGETVGGWATTLPEQTLHAWLDQQTKDGAPASNPTADDILAYAPEGSYARHCALIEKAAQDGLNGRLGLEGEYADNRRQLLAYRDGLARAGHEKAAQAIPAPGEWTRPANPAEGEEDGPCGVIVGNSARKTIIKTSWGVQPGMMLPAENEACRVDADNGDGAYTCTPYWAAPQTTRHHPDGGAHTSG